MGKHKKLLISFIIPFPPAKKNKIRFGKRGKDVVVYKDPSVSKAEDLIGFLALTNRKKQPSEKPISISMKCDFSKMEVLVEIYEVELPETLRQLINEDESLANVGSKKLPDLINSLAVVADALEGIIYLNDRQIVNASLCWI